MTDKIIVDELVTEPAYIDVLRVVNPFDRSQVVREQFLWQAGRPLAAYFTVFDPSFVISVNGHIVQDDQLGTTFIVPGDSLVICPVPGGGGDDKAVLRIVAMLAVAMVAGPAGTALAESAFGAAIGISETSAAMGISFAGGMLVNALLPPAKPSSQSQNDGPSYGIDGPKNTASELVPVPVCYGKHRMGGNLINLYVENVGDTQDVYMLFNAGEGPIVSITDIEINDQPIGNFKDVQKEIRLGWANQTMIPWFSDTLVPRVVGSKLTTAWTNFNTVGSVDKLRFDVGAHIGFVKVEKDGRQFAVSVPLEIEYRKTGDLGWTAFTGTTGIHTTVYHLHTYEGVFGLSQITGETTYTTATVPLSHPWSVVGTDLMQPVGLDAAGDTQIVKVGYITEETNYNAGMVFADKKTGPVRRSFTTDLLPSGTYETRIRRVEPDSVSTEVVDGLWIDDIYEITVADISYNNTALLGIKVRLTDQLSSLPRVTFVNGGRSIRTWNDTYGNWMYAGSDNPAWVTLDAMTDPRYGMAFADSRINLEAWKSWARHCASKGLAFRGLFDADQNAWDAMMDVFRVGHAMPVPVGTRFSVAVEGETEASMMFSVANIIEKTFRQSWTSTAERANEIEITYFDEGLGYKSTPLRIFDEAQLAAGVPQRTAAITMRGVVTRAQAFQEATLALNLNRYIKQSVEFDAPTDAIACTVGDVVYVQHDMPQWGYSGRFDAGSTASAVVFDRPVPMVTGKTYKLLVTYDSLQRASTTVAYLGGGYVFLNVLLSALTGPIKRLIKLGTEVGIDAVVSDGAGYVGVHLSSALTLAPGDTVTLWDTDAFAEVGIVNTGSGTATTVTTSSALPAAPAQFQHWMYGEVGKMKKPFRIRSISGNDPYVRSIAAIEYNGSVYSLAGAVPTPNYSDLASGVDDVVLGSVSESQVVTGGATTYAVTVHYDSAQMRYANAEVWVSRNGGTFELAGEHPNAFTVPGALGDTVVFKVVAMLVTGDKAAFDTAPTTTAWVVGSGVAFVVAPPTVVALAEQTLTGPSGGTTHGIRMTWVDSTTPQVSEYVVEGNIVGSGLGWQNWGVVAGDSTALSLSPITAGEVYQFRIRAKCPNGDVSVWVQPANITVGAIAPPTSVVNTSVSTMQSDGTLVNRLNIAWTASVTAAVSQYEIEGMYSDDAGWYPLGTSGTTSFQFAPVVTGKTALTRVRALTTTGARSAWANSNALVIGGDTTPPGAPTGLAGVGGVGSIKLTWVNPTDADYKQTEVWFNTVDDIATATKLTSVSGTGANHTALGTTPVTYFYWVRAVDYTGNIGAFNATIGVSATTTGVAPSADLVAPAAPTGLVLTSVVSTGTNGAQTVTLTATWTAPADLDLAYYEVDLKEGTGGYVTFVTGLARTYTWSVKSSTLYTVRVRAIDTSANLGAYCTPGTHTTGLDTVAPSAPTAFSAVAALRSIFLTWTNANGATDYDLAGVEVWRATVNVLGSAVKLLTVNALKGTAGGFTDSGLAPQTAYYYWLKSVDSSGLVSGFTAVATATTIAVADSDIAVGTLTGDRITGNTIAGDRFITNTSLPGTITIGATGVQIGTVESGTSKYRNTGAPSANASFSGSPTNAVTADGNVVVTVSYTYAQGSLPADEILFYWKEGGGTITAADPCFSTNAATGSIQIPLKPSTTYTFGLQTTRRTEAGMAATGINTGTSHTTSAGNYTGTVGGTAASTVVSGAASGAQDPATRINAGATTIQPGLVTISGGTTLASWRNGTDATLIEGGSIAANTITANKMSIGSRGVNFYDLTFQPNTPSTDKIAWTLGTVQFISDTGTLSTFSISSNSTGVLWGAGTTLYLYWDKNNPTIISTTTSSSVAYTADTLVLATYKGGAANLVANYGRTLIDGASIVTGTLYANAITANTIFASTLTTEKIVVRPIGSYSSTTQSAAGGYVDVSFTTSSEVVSPLWSAAIAQPSGCGASVIWTGNTTTTVTFRVFIWNLSDGSAYTGAIPVIKIWMF